MIMKRPIRTVVVALVAASCGCATIAPTSQKVRVLTEPAGASVAVLEADGRKELGASPVEYERSFDAYRCSSAAWLIPVATTLLGGGAGFGLAFATTHRPNSTGTDNRIDAGIAMGAVAAAIGLGLGIAVAAECRMKDGVVPGHHDLRVIVEAQKDGFLPASASLRIPSEDRQIELVLPPVPPTAP
jgi:hypothetical protein